MSLAKSWVTAVAATPRVLISHDDTVVCVCGGGGIGTVGGEAMRGICNIDIVWPWAQSTDLRTASSLCRLCGCSRSQWKQCPASGHVGWECLHTCSLRGVTRSSLHPSFGTFFFFFARDFLLEALARNTRVLHSMTTFTLTISVPVISPVQGSDHIGDVVFTCTGRHLEHEGQY